MHPHQKMTQALLHQLSDLMIATALFAAVAITMLGGEIHLLVSGDWVPCISDMVFII